MTLINGQPAHLVDVFDRGLQYGDGVFETIEIKETRPVFFLRHFDRLALGCKKLRIPVPELDLIKQEITQLIRSENNDSGIIKLTVTRGVSARGYRPPLLDETDPTRILSFFPIENPKKTLTKLQINVLVCDTRLSINPSLAGIKHLNRLEQVLARSEWEDPQIHEGLMLNTQGHVIEGTISNVFWVKDGVLFSPDITQCGIAGIIRSVIIESAMKQKIPIKLVLASIDDFLQAEEIFFTNSIIGLWPVKQIGEHIFCRGPYTDLAEQWIEQSKLEEIFT